MTSFFQRRPRDRDSGLPNWMHTILRTAGIYNIVAGVAMMTLYHEGFKFLSLERTDFMMPIQLVGVLVAVFGVGYLMVDRNPHENQNVLYLGFLSKAIGPAVSLIYIAKGMLPLSFLIVLFFADTIYLYPFWKIYHRIERLDEEPGPITLKFPEPASQNARYETDSKPKRSRRKAA